MRPSVNVTAVQRIVRLFFLVGVAIAAYLVLSFFDHAARADAGAIDQIGGTDPVASVKSVAADVRKAIPEPKPVARKARPLVPKAHKPKIHKPKIQAPKISTPKIQAPKIRSPKVSVPKVSLPKVSVPKVSLPKVSVPKVSAPKVSAPKIQATIARVAAGTAVREAQVRASELRQQSSDAARDAAATAVSRTRAAVVQLASVTQVPDQPQPRFPDLPKPWTPALTPLPVPAPQPPALPSGSVLYRPLTPPQTPELSGVTMPPTPLDLCALDLSALDLRAPELRASAGPSSAGPKQAAVAQPRTTPRPGPPPRQPVDRSTSTGQARDSGGGSSPATGTVSSSWWPEVAAAGRTLTTDLIARGRTVRYAGPPS